MAAADLLHDAAALEAIDTIRAACRAEDGVDPLDEAAHLRLKHHGLDGIGAWVRPDGFALRRDGEIDLAVSPEARDRGVGGQLAHLATRAPGALTAWSHGDHPAAAALAESASLARPFDRVRELWVMRRPSVVPLPAGVAPEGVTIRDFGMADADALLAVNAQAFAHHPEQAGLDAAGLADRMAEDWFDPAGLLLAVDEDGELLGFHWTKQHDERTGEVYVIGLAPAAQGRGLGRVLTLAGLQYLASRGVAEVILYVESDNAPARRLYDGLGFTHAPADTHVQYHRPEDREVGRNSGLGE